MAGVPRPHDTGRRDGMGRPIKVSDRTGGHQASASGADLDAAADADLGGVRRVLAAMSDPASPDFNFELALDPEQQDLCRQHERHLQTSMSSVARPDERALAEIAMGEIAQHLGDLASINGDHTATRWCQGRCETLVFDTSPDARAGYERDGRTLERVAPPPGVMKARDDLIEAAGRFLEDLEDSPSFAPDLAALDTVTVHDRARGAAIRYGYDSTSGAASFAAEATKAWQARFGPSDDDLRAQLQAQLDSGED